MNRHPDIDRTLEVFFLDGPSEMPDRLFEAVLGQVDRVPQRRLARLQLRFQDMSATARLIAASAAAVLVVGIGVVAFGRGSGEVPGGPPSATISPSPSASASSSPVAVELRHPFLGEHRSDPPAPGGEDRSILEFTETTFTYNGALLTSQAASQSTDTIVLQTQTATAHCAAGDRGVYSWAASEAGPEISFTLVRDDCAARAAVVPGDWLRSDCANPENFCLGPLEAGRYSSFYVDPFIPTGGPWRPRFGAITYEVPEGWENRSDYPQEYHLERIGQRGEGILVRSDVRATTLADPCGQVADADVGESAAEIAAWLVAAEGVITSEAVEVEIGGLSGVRIDVSLDPAWTQACSWTGGRPYRMLFVDADPGDGFAWGVDSETVMRVYLLDLGDGRTLLIDIEAPTRAGYEAILDEATAIAESMTFTR